MITGIAIENFKGIGDRVEIQLKPITLLFGPNSAGKSTLVHALHYAWEVLGRRNLDADVTVSGGKFIDLGGFSGFIHGHDKSRSLVIRIDATVTDSSVFEHELDISKLSAVLEGFEATTLFRKPKLIGVEVVVSWSPFEERPFVEYYRSFIDGQLLGEITGSANLRTVGLSRLDLEHPILTTPRDFTSDLEESLDGGFDSSACLQSALDSVKHLFLQSRDGVLELSGMRDALPNLDGTLDFSFAPQQPVAEIVAQRVAAAPETTRPKSQEEQQKLEREEQVRVDSQTMLAESLAKALSCLIVGPGQLLREELQKLHYLGPLREVPPRNYEPPRYPDPSRWASGLGAWDALINQHEDFVQKVSDWLADSDRLNSGCRIERRRIKEIDLSDPIIRQLVTGRAFDDLESDTRIDLAKFPEQTRLVIVSTQSEVELQPHDVGVGISQLVPVIVTALEPSATFAVIEQPELHVHPRLQAELGDLFLEAVSKADRIFLLETHSEHLILRLQRRIRETTNGKPHLGVTATNDVVGVHYVRQENGQTCVIPIDLDVHGDFVQPWPDDFFEIDFYERFGDAR